MHLPFVYHYNTQKAIVNTFVEQICIFLEQKRKPEILAKFYDGNLREEKTDATYFKRALKDGNIYQLKKTEIFRITKI